MNAINRKMCRLVHKNTALVVTGGSSGIGAAFIKLIQNIHPKILVCNLSRTKPDFFDAGSTNLRHFPCDLADPEALTAVLPALLETLRKAGGGGEILLINNSGIGAYGASQEIPADRQLSLLDLNVRAVVHLTALLMPLLLERGGTVINIASTAAFQPTPQLAAYGASKSFVLNWSLALGDDLRGTGVRTLCVCPGPTATRFFSAAGFAEPPLPKGVGQSAEAVVCEALRAYCRGKSLVVTGLGNRISTFFAARVPKVWVTRIAGIILRKIR